MKNNWREGLACFEKKITFCLLTNLVNVLRLDDRLEVILQNFCEIILKLRASEVGQNLRPI
jgi:hypothetical protein